MLLIDLTTFSPGNAIWSFVGTYRRDLLFDHVAQASAKIGIAQLN